MLVGLKNGSFRKFEIDGYISNVIESGKELVATSFDQDSTYVYEIIADSMNRIYSLKGKSNLVQFDSIWLIAGSNHVWFEPGLREPIKLETANSNDSILRKINSREFLLATNLESGGTRHQIVNLSSMVSKVFFRNDTLITLDLLPDNEGKNIASILRPNQGELIIQCSKTDTFQTINHNIPFWGHRAYKSMYFDRSNNLWIGTWGLGAFCATENEMQFRKTEISEDSEELIVPFYSNDTLVFSISSSGKVWQTNFNNQISTLIYETDIFGRLLGYTQKKHMIYIPLFEEKILSFDTRDYRIDEIDLSVLSGQLNPIYATGVLVDSKDRFWVISNGSNSNNNIMMFDSDELKKTKPSINYYNSHDNLDSSFTDPRINDIFEYNGDIYITNQGYGLFRFDQLQNKFTVVRKELDAMGASQFVHITEKGPYVSTYGRGFQLLNLQNHAAFQEFSLSKQTLPFSWVENYYHVQDEKFLIRGETEKWYLLNCLDSSLLPINNYPVYSTRLGCPKMPNFEDFKVLPADGGFYLFDPNYRTSPIKNNLIISGFFIKGEKISINPFRLDEIQLKYYNS